MRSFDPLNTPLTGTSLIEASAGTGKTHAIEGLFLRLILEKRLSVEQTLVVTFTKAATEELKTRIRTRLIAAQAALEQGSSDDLLIDARAGQYTSDTVRVHGTRAEPPGR